MPKATLNFLPGKQYAFWYTNHEGRREYRKIIFFKLQFGSNDYHTNEWMLHGWCRDRNDFRSFAFSGITTPTMEEI